MLHTLKLVCPIIVLCFGLCLYDYAVASFSCAFLLLLLLDVFHVASYLLSHLRLTPIVNFYVYVYKYVFPFNFNVVTSFRVAMSAVCPLCMREQVRIF
jgi:hypothetical protein